VAGLSCREGIRRGCCRSCRSLLLLLCDTEILSRVGALISECLRDLPLEQREVLLLREVEGLGTKEICKILDLSVTHCGVLMYRAQSCSRVLGGERRQ
jgi:DNA-directed RNA polymerase specialized sigma24 family protein